MESSEDRAGKEGGLLWVARGLAVGGLAICGYLAWVSWAEGGQAAGCGGEAECGGALTGRWSTWLGLPVSLPAVVVYAGALGALGRVNSGAMGAWRVLVAIAAMLVGAAAWFVAMQVREGTICLYCLAAHACGVALAAVLFRLSPVRWPESGRPIAAGMAGVVALAAGQWAVEPGGGMEVVAGAAPAAPGRVEKSEPVGAVEGPTAEVVSDGAGGRQVTILRGKIALGLEGHPYLGTPDAKVVLVEMYDYTCAQCRAMHGYLKEARGRYGDAMGLLLLPVPMNSHCNEHISFNGKEHLEACEIARLALAAWRAKPEAFPELHDWLMERDAPAEFSEARDEAARLVGEEALAAAMADPEIERQLGVNVRLYGEVDAGTIPKLYGETAFAVGAPRNSAALATFLESRVGLRPVPAGAEAEH